MWKSLWASIVLKWEWVYKGKLCDLVAVGLGGSRVSLIGGKAQWGITEGFLSNL